MKEITAEAFLSQTEGKLKRITLGNTRICPQPTLLFYSSDMWISLTSFSFFSFSAGELRRLTVADKQLEAGLSFHPTSHNSR